MIFHVNQLGGFYKQKQAQKLGTKWMIPNLTCRSIFPFLFKQVSSANKLQKKLQMPV